MSNIFTLLIITMKSLCVFYQPLSWFLFGIKLLDTIGTCPLSYQRTDKRFEIYSTQMLIFYVMTTHIIKNDMRWFALFSFYLLNEINAENTKKCADYRCKYWIKWIATPMIYSVLGHKHNKIELKLLSSSHL